LSRKCQNKYSFHSSQQTWVRESLPDFALYIVSYDAAQPPTSSKFLVQLMAGCGQLNTSDVKTYIHQGLNFNTSYLRIMQQIPNNNQNTTST
jgi:hypothetical protein